jgi:hypothetical protein
MAEGSDGADDASRMDAFFRLAEELAEKARANGHTVGGWAYDDPDQHTHAEAVMRATCETCAARILVVLEYAEERTPREGRNTKPASAVRWPCPNRAKRAGTGPGAAGERP